MSVQLHMTHLKSSIRALQWHGKTIKVGTMFRTGKILPEKIKLQFPTNDILKKILMLCHWLPSKERLSIKW